MFLIVKFFNLKGEISNKKTCEREFTWLRGRYAPTCKDTSYVIVELRASAGTKGTSPNNQEIWMKEVQIIEVRLHKLLNWLLKAALVAHQDTRFFSYFNCYTVKFSPEFCLWKGVGVSTWPLDSKISDSSIECWNESVLMVLILELCLLILFLKLLFLLEIFLLGFSLSFTKQIKLHSTFNSIYL